jgi:RNA polymerase sigma-70 factor, ECF subfamily
VDDLTILAVAASDGDRIALRAFIEASQGDVWRFAAHQVGWAEADDVTQDVFVRAWRALPSFRGDSSARTWLLAIARRACVDARRRRSRRRRLTEALIEGRAGTAAHPDASSSHALATLVDALDVRLREAFVLTQLLGCSYQQAAVICGTPIGTVRSRVARARDALTAQLREAAR